MVDFFFGLSWGPMGPVGEGITLPLEILDFGQICARIDWTICIRGSRVLNTKNIKDIDDDFEFNCFVSKL